MKLISSKTVGSVMKSAGSSIKEFSSKHSYVIAGCVGMASVVATGVFAYMARPKMDIILAEAKAKMDALNAISDISEEEYKKTRRKIVLDALKKATPVMAPTVIAAISGWSAIGYSIASGTKKIADATTIAANATSLANAKEMAYNELYDKTKEIVGEEKAQEIQKEIDQNQVNRQYGNDISEEAVDELFEIALQARGGNQVYYDPMFGRQFKSDDDTLESASHELFNRLKRKQDPEAYITYNEFYNEIDLPGVTAGDDYAIAWYDSNYTTYAYDGNSITGAELNLGNTVKIGKRAVTVLHWMDKPIPVEYLKPKRH